MRNLNILLQMQSTAEATSAQGDGKIMVVAGVLSVIFLGIVIYLISIDRKIKQLEKK